MGLEAKVLDCVSAEGSYNGRRASKRPPANGRQKWRDVSADQTRVGLLFPKMIMACSLGT